VTRKLRALWALHVTEGLSERDLVELLGHESEYLRSWAVYLLVEGKNPSDAALREFARMARLDQSSLVRLYLASALQRVPAEKRWEVLAGLLANGDDAADQNLPLMVWYAAEPVVAVDMARALSAAIESKLPRVFGFTVQRIAAIGTQEALRVLTDRLGRTEDPIHQKELLSGISKIVNKG